VGVSGSPFRGDVSDDSDAFGVFFSVGSTNDRLGVVMARADRRCFFGDPYLRMIRSLAALRGEREKEELRLFSGDFSGDFNGEEPSLMDLTGDLKTGLAGDLLDKL